MHPQANILSPSLEFTTLSERNREQLSPPQIRNNQKGAKEAITRREIQNDETESAEE